MNSLTLETNTTFLTIRTSKGEELLPLDKVILIKRVDDIATILCEGKFYFPKESYSELREIVERFR